MWLFLLGAVGPLAVRALTVIGFTALTFTGVTAAVNALVASAQSSWGSLPLAVLQLATIAGVPECLGIVFGAVVALVAMWAASQSVKLIFKPS